MAFGTREPFDYQECGHCGCLQIAEIPIDLERYYPEAYYTRGIDADRSGVHATAPKLRVVWTELRLRLGRPGRLVAGRRYGRFDWFTRTGTARDDAILDVGCGSGRLLTRLHREGFENLTGIDPALGRPVSEKRSPRFLAESLEAHAADVARRSEQTSTAYRLVMAHHSFEHVTDPRRAFDSFARLVEPKGWLLLRIPVADSRACRDYEADWVQLDAPRHLHLHTRRSIETLCTGAGFRIAHIVDDSGPFQIWGSELYRRDVELTRARRERRLFCGRESPIAARLLARSARRQMLGDQMCFYLQRTDGRRPLR